MSDENQEQNQAVQERDALKARANILGIKLSGNQSNETIRMLINQHMEKMDAEADESEEAIADDEAAKAVKVPTLREFLVAENMRLVRVRITCMDPKKTKLTSEIITVANEHLGTIRKIVPFGEQTDEGYHLPVCILKVLQRRKFQQITMTKVNGVEMPSSRWVKEFSIEHLPMLTKTELRDLAQAQQAVGAIQ